MNHIVSAVSLSKQVDAPAGRLTILDDVSLAVVAGAAVAIVGPSGSGKSTLLGLLAGLDLPSTGQVSLLGVDLATLDEDGRAKLRAGKVGFVFQSFQLLAGLTAMENVLLPLELTGSAQPRSRAAAALEEVGLSARLGHYPSQLSGGEQQRVALARAFASQPQILFADEPTGNLDLDTGNRIADLLFAMQSSHGTTLILVTHDPLLAARCDRQVYLEAGRSPQQQVLNAVET